MRRTKTKKKVINDNQKISTFFKKLESTARTEKVEVVESDEDIIPSTPIARKQGNKRVLSPITNDLVRKRKLSPSDSNNGRYPKKTTKTENSPPPKIEDIPSTSRANGHLVVSDKISNGDSNFYVDDLSKNTEENTPEKLIFSPIIGGKSSEQRKKNSSRSCSPKKKLFEKLPDTNDFRVDVIKNFITVTPSKSNKKLTDVTPTKSKEKKQKSILNYISPSLSSRSQKAQSENESTPIKTPSKKEFIPTTAKVKLKLTFGELETKNTHPCDTEIEKENKYEKAMEEVFEDSMNLFNDSWDNISLTQDSDTLDLSKPKRCQVIKIEKIGRFQIEVRLQCIETNEKANCLLEGFWATIKIEVGSMVYIDAVKHSDTWKLTNNDGLLVYEPDLLISSTSVVGALFCKRRSVLKERFIGFEPENKAMIVGTLVHSLLQNALKSEADNKDKIDIILKELLGSKNMVRTLYKSSSNFEEISKELSSFVPRILEFIQDYVKGKKTSNLKQENWKGHIDSIRDIEENIWCPELGMKGKVDVSVSVSDEIMPLELKTGKASFSLEHRGQVMIYIMMMQKLGYKVTSGLLLYLREGILRPIPNNEREKRDIIMLRNELTYYLTRKTEIRSSDTEENEENESNSMKNEGNLGRLELMELPDPIQHHSACEYCPYNTICCSYLRYQNYNLSSFKALKQMSNKVLEHLTDKHIEYFVHWSNLLDLESSNKLGKNVSTIYTKSPAEREKMGRCITELRISDCVIEGEGMFKHTFRKAIGEHCQTFLTSGLGEGSYIVISTERRPAVSSGLVSFVNHDSITVALDRDLREKFPISKFHLDSYDSSSLNMLDFTNISLLLEPTERASKLRSLIIDKSPPVFVNKLPKIVAQKAPTVLKSLNKVQQRATLRSLTASDYVLIQGMPGTGKTATIVALVQLLTEIGQTVLITSHTHSAVDNMCLRLKKIGINVLRLGTLGRIHPELLEMSEHFLTKDCNTPDELERVYNEAKILAVTCLGTKHPVLSKRTLDVCIVDESTQVLQCSVIRALSVCKKFILIGDPEQLPPVVKNQDAIARGMSESLFERLQSETSTVTLNLNYRMNKTITKLANDFMYNGQLQIANDTVANACLKFSTKKHFIDEKWLFDALDDRLESAVKIIDTQGTYNLKLRPRWLETLCLNFIDGEEQKSCTNACETAIVVNIIAALLQGGILKEDIGVIAPYRAQVAQLSTVLQSTGIDVSTVDQFQGKDKSVIIYSCTKSNDPDKMSKITKFNILEDRRRLNVAVTRAKHKLILLGDLVTIEKYSPFAKLLSCVKKCHFIRLQNGIDGFDWDPVINLVP